MKKIFTLCLLASVAMMQANAYTLAELAQVVGTLENKYEKNGETITEIIGVAADGNVYTIMLPTGFASDVSGIGYDDNKIVLSKSYLTVNGDVVVAPGETLLFAGAAQIEVNGNLTATNATFGAAEGSEATAKGIRMYQEGVTATLDGCTLDYVTINYGNGTANGTFIARNCTFNNTTNKGGNSAINFTSATSNLLIEGCVFNDNQLSSIASGASVGLGGTIKNNVFNKSITSTRLYPALNISVSDQDIYIEDNEVHGPAANTRAGGIAVSNLLGGANGGTTYIRRNFVEDCSYGITLTGSGNIVMEENTVLNNRYIANPNQGGSGINITINSTVEGALAKAYMRGNHIEGNIWGVTIIGTNVDINAGKLVDHETGAAIDPSAEDYNPGENVFVNNIGTDDYPHCDWFNNTTTPVYAQGNTWDVEVQDEEHIYQNIYSIANKTDVYVMPAGGGTTAITDVKSDVKVSTGRYNLLGQPVDENYRGIVIENGQKVIR